MCHIKEAWFKFRMTIPFVVCIVVDVFDVVRRQGPALLDRVLSDPSPPPPSGSDLTQLTPYFLLIAILYRALLLMLNTAMMGTIHVLIGFTYERLKITLITPNRHPIFSKALCCTRLFCIYRGWRRCMCCPEVHHH